MDGRFIAHMAAQNGNISILDWVMEEHPEAERRNQEIRRPIQEAQRHIQEVERRIQVQLAAVQHLQESERRIQVQAEVIRQQAEVWRFLRDLGAAINILNQTRRE
jgi:hypothetical protein